MRYLSGVEYAPLPAGYGPALSPFPPRLIVIHFTDNASGASALSEATYAHNRSRDGATSAHFYVDTHGPLGSVPLDQHAWASLAHGNAISHQVEICTWAGRPPTDGAQAEAALLVAELAAHNGVPLVKLTPAEVRAGASGICGHYDITQAYPEDHGTHTDAGPGWDWVRFIGQCNTAALGVYPHPGGPTPTPAPAPVPPTVGVVTVNVTLPVLARDDHAANSRPVQRLQACLNVDGGYNLAVDGVFGPKTQAAVEDFQTRHHLSVDGVVGAQTWPALLTA